MVISTTRAYAVYTLNWLTSVCSVELIVASSLTACWVPAIALEVSVAADDTELRLVEMSWLLPEASEMLRAISVVVAVCSSTAEAIVVW